jgi:xanthine dehydrogenase accessory factor
MVMPDILERAVILRGERTAFVLATVVASYPPQSVRPGAKAIIFADGSIDGWIGGGCIRPVVLDEAREALVTGASRLVRMNAGTARTDGQAVRTYPMTCQGEGGVEIYLEPMFPAPRLCILGDTPVAHALAALAREAGHALVTVPDDAEAVVVATMGVGDEEALDRAARSGASYVGLVASRKKASFLFDYARATGVPDESLARVKAPAGLDLGGMSPPEIAISILAEIVQRHNARAPLPRGVVPEVPVVALQESAAVDPICGMSVERATAKHTLDIGGETFYFCCPHCKARFAKAHA